VFSTLIPLDHASLFMIIPRWARSARVAVPVLQTQVQGESQFHAALTLDSRNPIAGREHQGRIAASCHAWR
jgi:hypothetical protein